MYIFGLLRDVCTETDPLHVQLWHLNKFFCDIESFKKKNQKIPVISQFGWNPCELNEFNCIKDKPWLYTQKKIKQATSDEIIQNLIYCLSAKKGMSAAAEWWAEKINLPDPRWTEIS